MASSKLKSLPRSITSQRKASLPSSDFRTTYETVTYNLVLFPFVPWYVISTLSLTFKILYKKCLKSFTIITFHMRIYEITNLKTKPCRLIITDFGFPNSPEIGQNKNYVSIILLFNIHIKFCRRRMKDCKNCIRSYPLNKKARRGPTKSNRLLP